MFYNETLSKRLQAFNEVIDIAAKTKSPWDIFSTYLNSNSLENPVSIIDEKMITDSHGGF